MAINSGGAAQRYAQLTAFVLPVVAAALLAALALHLRLQGTAERAEFNGPDDPELVTVSFSTYRDLERFFEEQSYHWPLREGDTVPALAVDDLPEDLAAISDVQRKKSVFFRALLPIVLSENERVRRQRQMVQEMFVGGIPAPGTAQRQWLDELLRRYGISGDPSNAEVQQVLLRRLDVIPPALVLAQAANESAWGTSRFAQLGNNLFGMWTTNEHAGIIPAERPKGHTYAVQRFASVRASVRAYMRNLNSHRAYLELRTMREAMRRNGHPLDPVELAKGLFRYSERGQAYVKEIQRMIRGNDLIHVRQLQLRQPKILETQSHLPSSDLSGCSSCSRLNG